SISSSKPNCMSGVDLARVFWLTIAAHGSGLEFISQDLPNGDQESPVTVNSDVQQQAKTESRQLAALGPCILTGKPVAIKSSEDVVDVAAWQYGNSTCVMAINSTDHATNATLSIPSVGKAKTARVFWQGRSVKVAAGAVSESFAPARVDLMLIQNQK
ncbi:MAG TPA: hypothetical protein V6C72_07320, partial [Chroococcales cyanobacterium]